jgi:DnaJ-class molecular chaperone
MSTKISYYEILEVEQTCSKEDLRKAYKKLALRWHPDRNPEQKEVAEQRFKEISEAYQILSDKDKRRTYDLTGETADDFVSEKSGFSDDAYESFQNERFVRTTFVKPEDLFQSFFGGDPFFFRNDPFGDPFFSQDSFFFGRNDLFGHLFGRNDPFGGSFFGSFRRNGPFGHPFFRQNASF